MGKRVNEIEEEYQSRIRFQELMSNTPCLDLSTVLLKLFGLQVTTLLAELQSLSKKLKTDNGWFPRTHKMLEEGTSLSAYQQNKALKLMKEKGLIQIRTAGLPARNYYKINSNKINKLISTYQKNTL